MRKYMYMCVCLCTSICYGDQSIGMSPSINPATSVMSQGAVARNSATKYQINYQMVFFNFFAKIDAVASNVRGYHIQEKYDYDMSSLQHGLSLSFFKDRDDDIFYGNTLTFLSGHCDLNHGENIDVDKQEDSGSWALEDLTSVGILFPLNQTKTIKVGPVAGFGMSFKKYKLDKSFTKGIFMLYAPVGVFGEILLGDEWVFTPQVLFNFCFLAEATSSIEKLNKKETERINPFDKIELSSNKIQAINVKADFSKKLSSKVSFHITPFFSCWDFGKSSKRERKSMQIEDGTPAIYDDFTIDVNAKFYGYEYGLIFGIKF